MLPRVLFIAPLPPPVHGSSMVSKYIKDSKIIQREFYCDFVNLSTSRKMNEIGKRNIKKIFRFISSYLSVFFKLLFHKYDLCYLAITCHGTGFLKDAPFVLLCKLFGRKVVIHQHNKGMSHCVDRWPYCWLLPLVYRNTKVILLSWHLYKDISKVVGKEQILICPNGIPEIKETTIVSELNNPVPRLLFLSNLIESKGVYVLLDACKILKDKGYKFVCDFVGGVTKEIDQPVFEAAVKERKIDECVVYQGPKYGNEKHRVFANADIFVFPTYYFNECFPLVLLEAMQYHLPIVTSNEGGIPDVVEDGFNGYICQRKDVNSLVLALEKLLNDKKLREDMGVNGYQIYKNKFTLEAFEKNMNDILQSLITRNSKSIKK